MDAITNIASSIKEPDLKSNILRYSIGVIISIFLFCSVLKPLGFKFDEIKQILIFITGIALIGLILYVFLSQKINENLAEKKELNDLIRRQAENIFAESVKTKKKIQAEENDDSVL